MTITDLRTFATFDGHGGKVSKRVEVLDHEPAAGSPHEGLVAVRGEHPLGALDERAADESAALARGVPSVGWVDPSTLRDWYRPDRVVITRLEARQSGIEPGLYADSAVADGSGSTAWRHGSPPTVGPPSAHWPVPTRPGSSTSRCRRTRRCGSSRSPRSTRASRS